MKGAQEPKTADSGRLVRELTGLFAIFCGLLVILSLATFDGRDPWLNHVISGTVTVRNKAGLFGAYLAGLLYDGFGAASWALPAFFCLAGARRIIGHMPIVWWRWTGFVFLGLCVCLAGAARDQGHIALIVRGDLPPPGTGNVSTHGGGMVGDILYRGLVGWMGVTGAFLVWVFCLLMAFHMLTGVSWFAMILASLRSLRASFAKSARYAVDRLAERRETKLAARAPGQLAPVPSAHQTDAETGIADSRAREDGQGGFVFENGPNGENTPGGAIHDLFARDYSYNDTLRTSDVNGNNGTTSDGHDTGQNARQSRMAPSASGHQHLVHPALVKNFPKNGKSGGVVQKAADFFRLYRKKGEEGNLPQWVKDFEEGRIGAPSGQEPHPVKTGQEAERPHDPMRSGLKNEYDQFAGADKADRATPGNDEDPLVVAWDEPRHVPSETESAGERRADGAVLPPGHPERQREAQEADAGIKTGEPDQINIFEAPPIQAAAKPGILQRLTRRVKRELPLPTLDLLEAVPPSKGFTPREELEEKGRSLMTCLKDFGVQGELVGITPGPVVTMFEVRPAPGVRVSRIANLSDDLALALKAVAVRIQAPVPGTDTVGIEIPNQVRDTVCFKELIGSDIFARSKSLLTIALGKDIAGLPSVADLAAMPHLLVAGATGAGKSVGINSIILSLIYKARPDQVKLLLVDPKRVEMAIYADLPHLVHPVVTEMQIAKNALEWAVAEMEQRYQAIARAGVRNITDYNAKIESWKDSPPEGREDLEFIPYLVVIIDELADLMLVAAKEVETSIVRLAQLARAAGIHLILATQRPSVDVVTGLIKANFPCRISFQVTSKHDSRTILDTVGAEQLLGRGDMLYKPAGGKFRRMHGAFVSDKNVTAVVDYWKRQQSPEYAVDFADWATESAASGASDTIGGNGDVAADPLYNEAVDFVRQQGKASISLIQRKFRIGFNKAARFVEQMEQDGIIGPADGSRPRTVIR